MFVPPANASLKTQIEAVKRILPDHYSVNPGAKPGSIRCKSSVGIRRKIDAEDEEHWGYVVNAIKAFFGNAFQEIDHNICFCHVDFLIYFKPALIAK